LRGAWGERRAPAAAANTRCGERRARRSAVHERCWALRPARAPGPAWTNIAAALLEPAAWTAGATKAAALQHRVVTTAPRHAPLCGPSGADAPRALICEIFKSVIIGREPISTNGCPSKLSSSQFRGAQLEPPEDDIDGRPTSSSPQAGPAGGVR
jgi:hypothetical protein